MNGKPLEKSGVVLKLILETYTITNAATVVSQTTHQTGGKKKN